MSILRNFLKRLNSEEEEVESGKKIKVSKSVNNFEKNEKMFCANWNEMHSTASQTTNAQPPLQTSATQTGNLASSLFVSSNMSKKIEKDNTKNSNQPQLCKVLMMGEGSSGQLGLGYDLQISPDLTEVAGLCDVVDVCAGGMHTLVLTARGKVYSYGCNDQGALGRKFAKDSDWFTPQPVTDLQAHHVVRISAGDSHSAAVTKDGKLFIWGTFRKENGDTRLTSKHEMSGQPLEIATPTRVIDVQSGSNHLIVLTDDCEVMSMGTGERGQLGRIPESFDRPSDSLLFELLPVTMADEFVHVEQIWAGNYASFARDAEGEIYAWGLNNYHQLGFNDTTSRYRPCRWLMNPSMDVLQISPGDHHTLLLNQEGEVFSIGKGHYGQLGHGKVGEWNVDHPEIGHAIYQSEVATFTKVEDIGVAINVMAGLSVSFAVSQDGNLYRWGQKSFQLGGKGDDDDDDEEEDDEEEEDVFIPEMINCSTKLLKVSSNGLHTAVMSAL